MRLVRNTVARPALSVLFEFIVAFIAASVLATAARAEPVPLTSAHYTFAKTAVKDSSGVFARNWQGVFHGNGSYFTPWAISLDVGTASLNHVVLTRGTSGPWLLLDDGLPFSIGGRIDGAAARFDSPRSGRKNLGLVVWTDNRAAGRHGVYSCRVDLDGWSALDKGGATVHQGATDDSLPAVAWNRRSDDLASWWITWTTANGVHLRRMADDGTFFDQEPLRLSANAGSSLAIRCRRSPDWCVMAWHDDVANNIQVRTFSSDPGTLAPVNAYSIPSSGSGRNVVAMETGVLYVDRNADISYSMISPVDGHETERKTVVQVPTAFQDFNASLLEERNTMLLAWSASSGGPMPSDYGIYGQRLTDTGVPIDPESFQIAPPNTRFDPVCMATDGSTGWMVNWRLEDFAPWAARPIEGAMVEADGTVGGVGPASVGASPEESLAVAAAGNNIYGTWIRKPPMKSVVLGNLYDSSGHCIGPDCLVGQTFVVDDQDTGNYHTEAPRVDSDGTGFLVVWTSDTNGIEGQLHSGADGWSVIPPGIFRLSPPGGSMPSLAWGASMYLVVWSVGGQVLGTMVLPDGTVVDPEGFLIRAGYGAAAFHPVAFDGLLFHVMGPGGTRTLVDRDGHVLSMDSVFDGGDSVGIACANGECLAAAYVAAERKLLLRKVDGSGGAVGSELSVPALQTGNSWFGDAVSVCRVGDQYAVVWNEVTAGYSTLEMVRVKDHGVGLAPKLLDMAGVEIGHTDVGVRAPACTVAANGKLVVAYSMWDDALLSVRGRLVVLDHPTEGSRGAICDEDVECASGFCVDGVCCDTACAGGTGDCQACSTAAGAMVNGTCGGATGTFCDDGSPCTQTDTCEVGVCTGGNPIVCTASDECHDAGTCDPFTGACTNPAKPDGTFCDDGSLCTQTDTCQNGICLGGSPVECASTNPCLEEGKCDPSSGTCAFFLVPDGSVCSDGDECTRTDTCLAGACIGSDAKACEAADACHLAGTCDPTTGACSSPTQPDGTSCDLDGSRCTPDACLGGACAAGTAVECAAADACHLAGTCDPTTGACSSPTQPDGTSCDLDGSRCTPDACLGGTCAAGTAVECAAADACHLAGTCDPTTGACTSPAQPDGSSCDLDGSLCTPDACLGGACAAGTAVECAAADQCHMPGTCDPTTGACTSPAQPDGTSCDLDGSRCTPDACQGGACAAGTAVECAAADQCHLPGTCDPTTGACSSPAQPDGTSCDLDGSRCTPDACQGGTCAAGTAVECSAADQCHLPGTCDPTTGACTSPAQPDGTPCDLDGSRCTPDACQGGACAAGTAVECAAADQCHAAGTCDPTTGACTSPAQPDGTPCDLDGSRCTPDACQGGTCSAGTAVECSAADQCHVAGTCDPTTGACTSPAQPDGTSCDLDGSRCTPDACQGGTCVAGTAVECAAADQCHVAGTCDPTTGACTSPAQPDGTSCDDGQAATGGDRCVSGVCTGEPCTCSNSSACCDGCLPASATTRCDDGDPCSVDDHCDGNGRCAGTAGPSCLPDAVGDIQGGGDELPSDRPSTGGGCTMSRGPVSALAWLGLLGLACGLMGIRRRVGGAYRGPAEGHHAFGPANGSSSVMPARRRSAITLWWRP